MKLWISFIIYQDISQLICEIISLDKNIWGFISQNNEHGVMQPLSPDVLGIFKTPWVHGFSVN